MTEQEQIVFVPEVGRTVFPEYWMDGGPKHCTVGGVDFLLGFVINEDGLSTTNSGANLILAEIEPAAALPTIVFMCPAVWTNGESQSMAPEFYVDRQLDDVNEYLAERFQDAPEEGTFEAWVYAANSRLGQWVVNGTQFELPS